MFRSSETAHPPAPLTASDYKVFESPEGYTCPLPDCGHRERNPSSIMLHLTTQCRHPTIDMSLLAGKRVQFYTVSPKSDLEAYHSADVIHLAPERHGFVGDAHIHKS